ncbi:MAG: hypothetical protein IJU48_05745 [Synergistaceae bacterium]|nr:hypothetical protein [Synergistaceae bacterium]
MGRMIDLRTNAPDELASREKFITMASMIDLHTNFSELTLSREDLS